MCFTHIIPLTGVLSHAKMMYEFPSDIIRDFEHVYIKLCYMNILWYFSLPSISISNNYLWYSLSITYRVRLALRGGR